MQQNHLEHEKSPYLLQHAHNPVDWYPWTEQAFEKARREERPVFLSIGYSTCHWCHVMERESFENQEVAALLNAHFVPVKVDREERPDIDAVYMAVCQALTGSGGWPLTLLLTPDKNPFYAGTYLPPSSRFGSVGLIELLQNVIRLWEEERQRLCETGEQIASFLSHQEQAKAKTPEASLLHQGFSGLRRGFDAQDGGFGSAPKFPTPQNLLFLLRYHELERNGEALRMVETTLTQMARGGIFDQIGGGFSRYSTDRRWLAPHFEKMLYDNALLACCYLEGYRVTGREFYRTVADRTLDYLLRELCGPEGEFFCGQDADSDGVEGKYYLLTPAEVTAQLGLSDGNTFCDWFDITPAGNFEGQSIPNLLENNRFESPDQRLGALCEQMREYRQKRTALSLDDKALTAWNAMAIAAFARAYRITARPERLRVAQRTLSFLQRRLTTEDGRLMVRWRDGEAAHPGQLDDYAFSLWALLELYSADFDPGHLIAAQTLAEHLEALFWDEAQGGFYLYAADAERLIARPKELYDGAIPSGNSVAALGLTLLAELTGEPRWRTLADRQLAYLAGNIVESPSHHSFALLALSRRLCPAGELVCACADEAPPEGLQRLAGEAHLSTLLKTPGRSRALTKASPFTAEHLIPKRGAVYYYCREGACQAPVKSLEAVRALLQQGASPTG